VELATGGVYGEEGYVYQLFDPLPLFDDFRPSLGAWIVGDSSAGLGIREAGGLVTDDRAAFVPHRIRLTEGNS
jgi:glutathionylspermidine synthase